MVFVTRKKSYAISQISASKALDGSFKRIEIEAVQNLFLARTGTAKIFYATLILLLFGILGYEIFKTVRDFRKSPVSSSLKIVNFDELVLPQIYICTSHRFPYKTLRFNESQVALALKLNQQLSMFYNEDPAEWIKNVPRETIDLKHENKTFIDLKKLWSFFHMDSLKRIFRNQQYRQTVTVVRDFDISKFHPIYDPYFGICYTLNLTDMPQIIEGAALHLFTTLQRHHFQIENHLLSKVPVFRGFYVSFAEKLDPTNLVNFIIVPASRLSKLALRKQNINMLPDKQKCHFKSGSDLSILNSGYSLKSCRLDCIMKLVVEQCHCLPGIDEFFLSNATLEKYQYCTVQQARLCRENKFIPDINLAYKIDLCHKSCATPCNFCRYNSRVSDVDLHEAPFFDYPVPKKNLTPWRSIWLDVVFLQVFYTDFNVVMISASESMSIHDVIGNLGAQVNLWIGMSMFTLVQIPTVLLFILCFYMWHSHSNRQVISYTEEFDKDLTEKVDARWFKQLLRTTNRNRNDAVVLQNQFT